MKILSKYFKKNPGSIKIHQPSSTILQFCKIVEHGQLFLTETGIFEKFQKMTVLGKNEISIPFFVDRGSSETVFRPPPPDPGE